MVVQRHIKPKATDSFCMYTAGFFDGEGSIQLTTRLLKKGECHALIVEVGNTKSTVIYTIAGEFDALEFVHTSDKSTNPKANKFTYLRLFGDNAIYFLQMLYPYLIIKKHHAEVAFLFHKSNTTEEKHGLFLEMKILNKRGK